MTPEHIFGPVLVQITISMVMFVRLAVVKARSVRAGDVDLERRSLHADAWPDYVIRVSNNVRNQFETPVLFYILAVILWATNAVGAVSLAMAWIYVASRSVHAYIHVSSSDVRYRLMVFKVGVLALIGLLILAVRGTVTII